MSLQSSLKALAVARSSEADEHMLGVYIHGLLDLDEEIVALACQRLAKLPRREYQSALPDVGTIRSEAARVQLEREESAYREKLLPGPSSDDDRRTWVSCRQCLDTGWQSFRCTGGTGHRGNRDTDLRLAPCVRRNEHAPHSYAEQCPCFDTNPVIAKRRERRSASETAA